MELISVHGLLPGSKLCVWFIPLEEAFFKFQDCNFCLPLMHTSSQATVRVPAVLLMVGMTLVRMSLPRSSMEHSGIDMNSYLVRFPLELQVCT